MEKGKKKANQTPTKFLAPATFYSHLCVCCDTFNPACASAGWHRRRIANLPVPQTRESIFLAFDGLREEPNPHTPPSHPSLRFVCRNPFRPTPRISAAGDHLRTLRSLVSRSSSTCHATRLIADRHERDVSHYSCIIIIIIIIIITHTEHYLIAWYVSAV